MHIALKETNETVYWLELLRRIKDISEIEFDSLLAECTSIRAMLVASIKTAKEGASCEKKE